MSEHGSPLYELRLVVEPRRFAAIRRIIQAHLRHWDLPELVDAAQLGATELLGNVHRHVGPGQECLLRLTADDEVLRLEVHDSSPVLPRLLHPDLDAAGGRGLGMVTALSKEWGAAPEGEGKVVWFTLQAAPRLDPARGGAGWRNTGAPLQAVVDQVAVLQELEPAPAPGALSEGRSAEPVPVAAAATLSVTASAPVEPPLVSVSRS
ncbi:ATP-binding protein [Streptacidiphilus albus]|uniref:ATP-binding protein n=1 Tax=Streptacidiphilus albus TaxID=105425 RepID=UPI001364AA9B|nr:ATP-binding protein [Streptacidiphilus albus]